MIPIPLVLGSLLKNPLVRKIALYGVIGLGAFWLVKVWVWNPYQNRKQVEAQNEVNKVSEQEMVNRQVPDLKAIEAARALDTDHAKELEALKTSLDQRSAQDRAADIRTLQTIREAMQQQQGQVQQVPGDRLDDEIRRLLGDLRHP